MLVAVAIPVHNRRELTLRALRTIMRAHTPGIDLRVIVVDDGSTDGTGDAIRQRFPEVTVLQGDGTLDYAGGTNAGLRHALSLEPDYVIAANDDSLFHRAFVERLVACATRHPRAIVGALLLSWAEPHRVFQVGQVWDTWYGGWRMPHHLTAFDLPRNPFEVQAIVGNCVLFPAEALRTGGLLDAERFPRWWGDAELTIRLRRAGWRLLIEPRALVWCQPNTLPPPLRTLAWRQVLHVLLRDRRHPLNLASQCSGRWATAPTRAHALIAFAVYVARLGLKAVGAGGAWPAWPDPRHP